jgi:hypothetical protein
MLVPFFADTKKCLAPHYFAKELASYFEIRRFVYKSHLFPAIIITISLLFA